MPAVERIAGRGVYRSLRRVKLDIICGGRSRIDRSRVRADRSLSIVRFCLTCQHDSAPVLVAGNAREGAPGPGSRKPSPQPQSRPSTSIPGADTLHSGGLVSCRRQVGGGRRSRIAGL
jgi:hypothetical protein